MGINHDSCNHKTGINKHKEQKGSTIRKTAKNSEQVPGNRRNEEALNQNSKVLNGINKAGS